ncbi:MAG: TrkH family potassium uptake protein [Butyricicoccus sp.]|nr:TrkH family potassium uptake protein [Butyricicoccus sp.]
MNIKIVGRTIGRVILMEALFMLPACIWCLIDRDYDVLGAYGLTFLIMLAAAGLLLLIGRRASENFFAQEGFVTVSLCWVVVAVMGCLPFYLSGQIPHFIDALFESISGFTTTGASILSDVEALSRGLLYWRSFTHWLGGMGILVFALAVVSDKNSGGTFHLMRAESPGPSVGKLTPRLKDTAVILYGIYIAMTVLCLIFLLLGGMPLFDSLCTAFGTAGTGGFGVRNDSMASYSPYLQNVCTVFMTLFGVNFSAYYLLLLRRFTDVFRDEELRCYLLIMAAATAAIAWNIRPIEGSVRDSIHHAAFQVSSIMTTTGFSTVNFDVWPTFSKAILLCLMTLGACAGSTGGGFKVIRLVLIFKDLKRNIRRTLRPRAVIALHVNRQPINSQIMRGVNCFLSAYVMLIGVSIILVSLEAYSLETTISAVLACFNNIGPGLDIVGPSAHFGTLTDLSKLVLSADMLLGRLEIFPILALFSRYSWRQRL